MAVNRLCTYEDTSYEIGIQDSMAFSIENCGNSRWRALGFLIKLLIVESCVKATYGFPNILCIVQKSVEEGLGRYVLQRLRFA